MLIYDLGIVLMELGIKLAAPFNEKARLWVEGRKNLLRTMAEKVDSSAEAIWIHAASLGEFEQARPIIEALRKEKPETKILVTFYSPSGYEIRKNYKEADYVFYLPSDRINNVRKFLDIVKPSTAIFIKYEFWLNYLKELAKRNIRTFIVSSIFRRNSIFFKTWGYAWRNALNAFETIFVQNNNSKELLKELGFDNVVVANDTRFDRVEQIYRQAKVLPKLEAFKQDKRLFVAGSTWQPDEELLQELINLNPGIKFVIAPHEMDEERIKRIIERTKGGAVRYTLAQDEELKRNQVLIIDTIGILSSIYRYAEWSYIGGGFGVGIHNTLEAATFALPIAFGPNYHKFKEAKDLIAINAACSIKNMAELEKWFLPLRDDENKRKEAARRAREYTASHQGATKIITKVILSKEEEK
ncbi:MAG: 3-deoxy-D-manno-octulosonic acid transferase [Alistipes sp.]|nr:3-deoxy-D-manno-octulosonic acid transferase [Candidatus Alistipes equi]